jgi:hypothetical protein
MDPAIRESWKPEHERATVSRLGFDGENRRMGFWKSVISYRPIGESGAKVTRARSQETLARMRHHLTGDFSEHFGNQRGYPQGL